MTLGLLLVCSQVQAQTPAQPPPQTPGAVFAFIDNAVALPPGDISGHGILNIRLARDLRGKTPQVEEFGAGTTVVKPPKATQIGEIAAGEWRIDLDISNLEKKVPVTRHLRVKVDDKFETADYTITNAYTDKFSWNVISLSSTVSWSQSQPITLMVTVGPVPATNLTANAVLTDDTTATTFGAADLDLCANRADICVPATAFLSNRTYRLFLRPKADAVPSPGKYVGSIELVASEDKSTASPVTVYVTNCAYKAWGIAVLALGVLLSLGITFGIRNQLARKQLLAPAVQLRVAFAALEARAQKLTCLGKAAELTLDRIGKWKAALTDASLEDKSFVPAFYAPVMPATVVSQTYQQFLDNAGAWTAALTMIIDDGLDKLSKMDTSAIQDATARKAAEGAIGAAWAAIDAQAGPKSAAAPAAPALDALAVVVGQQTGNAQTAVNKANGVEADADKPTVTPTETQRLRFEIAVLSLATWSVAALLTILVGSYVLVLSHLDFGRTNDFVMCLFWGLGLPTVGSQLAQATPASLASSLGVNLPKPTA
jgi:hypothetical protein